MKKPTKPPVMSKKHLKLVKAAGKFITSPFNAKTDLGFMARMLIMANLPYREPKEGTRVWIRTNGNYGLVVNALTNTKGKCPGLPYGSYPRLILAYIVTQAVKTKSPHISLGKSFLRFMRSVGVENGGKQYCNLKNQLERTLSASFTWEYITDRQRSREDVKIANKSHFWWNPVFPEESALWDYHITLSEPFFQEITKNPVPIHMAVVEAFKDSPLALDLYMFLSWRMFNLKKPVWISWRNLNTQLGGQYTNMWEFSRYCRKYMIELKALWPELNFECKPGRVRLSPSSRTLIPTSRKSENIEKAPDEVIPQ